MKSSKYSSLNIDVVFIDCLMSGIAFGKLLGIFFSYFNTFFYLIFKLL